MKKKRKGSQAIFKSSVKLQKLSSFPGFNYKENYNTSEIQLRLASQIATIPTKAKIDIPTSAVYLWHKLKVWLDLRSN